METLLESVGTLMESVTTLLETGGTFQGKRLFSALNNLSTRNEVARFLGFSPLSESRRTPMMEMLHAPMVCSLLTERDGGGDRPLPLLLPLYCLWVSSI